MMKYSSVLQKQPELVVKDQAFIIQSLFKIYYAYGGNSVCVIAKLYETHIIVQKQNQQNIETIDTIPFKFGLCFEMIRPQNIYKQGWNIEQCQGIRLDTGQEYIQLKQIEDKSHLPVWRSRLKSRLNQRGFHEQYKAKKVLGEGSFARVYKIQSLENQNYYAAKGFSRQEVFENELNKKSLLNEIDVMRNLEHKNLMRLYGVYESKNSIYAVLQLLDIPLYDKVKELHNFSLGQLRTVMRSILEGLVYMHSKGYMHRDLKLENILYKPSSQQCVIADFGLTENINAKKLIYQRCGTPGYVAPEILNSKDKNKYHCKCDIFSLGVIFHYLLLKKPVFPGTKIEDVLKNNRNCKINLNQPVYKRLSVLEIDLLAKMLEKDPAARISAQQALLHEYFHKDIVIQMDSIQLTTHQSVKPKKQSKVKKPKKLLKASEAVVNNGIKTPPPVDQVKENDINLMMKECVIPIKQESKDFEGLNSPPVPKRNINKGNMEKNQFTDVEGRFIEC